MLSADRETAAFDVEGTLTQGAAWEGMRDFLIREGQEASYRALRRAMMPRYVATKLRLSSEQTFKEEWVAGMLACLAGLTEAELQLLSERIVDDVLWPARRQDIIDELLRHQESGRQIVLVSGQFQPVLDAFVQRIGADAGIGTSGIWRDGRFTGELEPPFTTGSRKAAMLYHALEGAPLIASYGDSAADIPMLAMSAQPTAVYPDRELRRTAVSYGWRIIE